MTNTYISYRQYSWLSRVSNILSTWLLIFLSCLITMSVRAEETTLDSILDTLSTLTCETQGVGDLLRTEFSHTCIPASFFTFAVANIVSPGMYANTLLRVKINDQELFPGSCQRAHRVDFDDQKLSFAMCNNILLGSVLEGAISKTAVAIAKSMFTGTSPWQDIGNSWQLSKSSYHEIYKDQRVGDSGVMIDIGVIPLFPWKIMSDKDKICVATIGFSGWIPIGCKYIKEPFPISIYADFLSVDASTAATGSKITSLAQCSGTNNCYQRAYANSKTSIMLTGPIIECMQTMITKIMISNTVCNFEDATQVLNSNSRKSSTLYQFQHKMHLIVSMLLTIYVIFFGMKVILSGDIPSRAVLTNFIIKFLFVTYFAVGINISPNSGELGKWDGMVQWVFPFMLQSMSQFSSWIISASPSTLCDFSDVHYPADLRHLQLWDSLDCRISHYLGLDALHNIIVENAVRHNNFSTLDILSNSIPPYAFLLVPAIVSGYPQLVLLALMYPLLVISIGAFIVSATVVCMISIVILGILAPLFVPMYLFAYTKGYFDAWVKLLLSCMLQPMLAVVFMTTMLTVYDFGFYGTCKYSYKDLTYSGSDMQLHASNTTTDIGDTDKKSVRHFYLNQDWDTYDNQQEIDGCQNSLGFFLNNPFAFALNSKTFSDTMAQLEDMTGTKMKKSFPFLDTIKSSPSMFFHMVEMSYEKIKTLVIAMLTACLMLYLMYNLSESLAEFAIDMTEGISITNMSLRPQTLHKAGIQALNRLSQSSKQPNAAQASPQKDRDTAKDKAMIPNDNNAAKDRTTTGNQDKAQGTTDKISNNTKGQEDK